MPKSELLLHKIHKTCINWLLKNGIPSSLIKSIHLVLYNNPVTFVPRLHLFGGRNSAFSSDYFTLCELQNESKVNNWLENHVDWLV